MDLVRYPSPVILFGENMKPQTFPEFIQNLSEADLPLTGARGWLVNSENGQVLFILAIAQTLLPEHKHGDQWGIVVDGEMELTIGERTDIYRKGDSYFIPAGTTHKAVLYKGLRALDFFADRDRYQTRVKNQIDISEHYKNWILV